MKFKTGFEYLLQWFPDYDYHKLAPGVDPARLDFRHPENIVGYQQRAFIVHWCLKGAENGGIGLDVGCGSVVDPYCLGIDRYGRGEKDDYGGECKPHMVLRADKPLPFEPNSFGFLVANHALEHCYDTFWTLKEWLRIVKPNGIIALVLPDAKYGGADQDPNHKASFSAQEFKTQILEPLVEEGITEIIEFDTFKNNFSFNVVLKKKGR